MSRGKGVRLEGVKISKLASEVGLPHFVELYTPFTPRVLVGREKHPTYVDSTHESPYASRNDCMPAKDSPGNDSSLKDMLELISKLDNLENNIYFPSPDFEHSVRVKADRKINEAALIVASAAKSADAASKSAIAAAVTCKSAVAETMKITASQRKNACNNTAGRDAPPQAVITTVTCHTTPERIRSCYDVRSSGPYPNISVPSCVATTRVQDTKNSITPFNWPRQPSFDDDHTNVSCSKSQQSPLYNTLFTKNWTLVITTWSSAQSTPVRIRSFVGNDKHEKYPVYTPYPRADRSVYAVLEKEKQI